jgi:hypothetical protein
MPSRVRKNAEDLAIVALAGGATIQGAADAAGVCARTVHRRLNDPEFRRRVAEARAAVTDEALGKLVDGSTEAADVLRALLKAEDDRVKLTAARSILELGPRLKEAAELEERIAELESKLEENERAEAQEQSRPAGLADGEGREAG